MQEQALADPGQASGHFAQLMASTSDLKRRQQAEPDASEHSGSAAERDYHHAVNFASLTASEQDLVRNADAPAAAQAPKPSSARSAAQHSRPQSRASVSPRAGRTHTPRNIVVAAGDDAQILTLTQVQPLANIPSKVFQADLRSTAHRLAGVTVSRAS